MSQPEMDNFIAQNKALRAWFYIRLLDAFRKHDVKRARVMMEEHLQHGLYDLESDNLAQEKNEL